MKTSSHVLLLAITTAALLTACGPEGAQSTAAIGEEGDVSSVSDQLEGRRTKLRGGVFAFGGGPIAGARVCAESLFDHDLCATTDASGAYLLTGLRSGWWYDVTVKATGFTPSVATLRAEQADSSYFQQLITPELYAGLSALWSGGNVDAGKGLVIINTYSFALGVFPENTPAGDFGYDPAANPAVPLAGATYAFAPVRTGGGVTGYVQPDFSLAPSGGTGPTGFFGAYVTGFRLYGYEVTVPSGYACNHRLVPFDGNKAYLAVRPGYLNNSWVRCIATP